MRFHERTLTEQVELMQAALETRKRRQLAQIIESAVPFDTSVEPAYEPETPAYRCEWCKDLGYVDTGKRVTFCPKCSGDRAAAQAERLTGIAGDLKGYTLGTFIARHRNSYRQEVLTAAIQAAREATEKPYGFVGWYGGVGTGKTHLLVGVCQALREQGKDVHYTTTAELLDHLKDAFDPKEGERYSERFEHLLAVDVLALDELDRFHATSWAKAAFFRLVDHRYSRASECLTLWATNRQLRDKGGKTQSIIGDDTGYLESRLCDGRFLAVDMGQGDARPSMDRGKWLERVTASGRGGE